LRAKIWTFSKDLIDFTPKLRFFRVFRRATLDSFKGIKGLKTADQKDTAIEFQSFDSANHNSIFFLIG
jgi:hypothetical protein